MGSCHINEYFKTTGKISVKLPPVIMISETVQHDINHTREIPRSPSHLTASLFYSLSNKKMKPDKEREDVSTWDELGALVWVFRQLGPVLVPVVSGSLFWDLWFGLWNRRHVSLSPDPILEPTRAFSPLIYSPHDYFVVVTALSLSRPLFLSLILTLSSTIPLSAYVSLSLPLFICLFLSPTLSLPSVLSLLLL